MIYLDNNSTTPVLPEVLEAMLPCFAESFGNPSSIHSSGRCALAHIREARQQVAALLGCRPAEVMFTSGGTEGDNLALKGMMNPGDHLIVSAIEHSAILTACQSLEKYGCEVTRVGVNSNGQVEPDSIRAALRRNTRLISVMMANNETGVLQPLEEIGRIAAEADVWFHTDAVQAAGKVPIAVEKLRCDLLTISGHKIHGPQGIGALYLRQGTPLRPQLHGGHQEKSRRPGTENVPGIVGLGKAAQIALAALADGSIERIAALRNRLETAIVSLVADTRVNGQAAPRVANTSNILFEHIGGDAFVLALDELGIEASRGSACSAGGGDPSGVLIAMGLTGEQSRSSLRLSLGKQNTADEIESVIAAIPGCVNKLRRQSTIFWSA
ncbi:MAG TPA: cysteine desulfurase family protein [Acidobacteriaceae bacterium]|jgi:cysteine desulfurase|nr:cysteine desulfurase family protein [Acidobacteriaceae bacterium]